MTVEFEHTTLYGFLMNVLTGQLAAMKEQIPGVLQDADPEPLHDFRVASRRSRAAVSQMKPALHPAAVAPLAADYRVLADLTNRLRDLDVFVDAFDEYEILLPVPMRAVNLMYFQRVRRRRTRAARAVLAFFKSSDFDGRMKRLDGLLNGKDPPEPGELATEPAKPFGCQAILNRYKKVSKLGNRILNTWPDPGLTDLDGHLPDNSLHQLRIQLKKLRYMIEFFRSFFPADTFETVIEQMKLLQDVLGLYNDLSVQTGMIQTDIRLRRSLSSTDLAVLGALQAVLLRKKSVLFDEFVQAFARFTGKRTKGMFREVYTL